MSKFLKDLEFTFTGTRHGTDGDDDIDAIGFGGNVYAGKGHDTITVGTLAVIAYTGDGHDFVRGGSAYLKIIDENGNLDVRELSAWGEIEKSGHGDLIYAGASAAIKINHTGYEYGDIKYSGGAVANVITRKGSKSNITYKGAGGYNQIWHETNNGNLTFEGGGFYNKLTRTWFDKYKYSKGNIHFNGFGGGNEIQSRVETGDINFTGGGLANLLKREGKLGDISMSGAGAYNELVRTSQHVDIYKETSGNIHFEGAGGYNNIFSDIAQGNITFYGVGAYNKITRTTQVRHHNDLSVEYTKAENIVLTSAYMKNLSLGTLVEVKAIKSLREPNTYLFKTPGPSDTNLFISDYGRRDYTFNKVKIYNDPKTGKLQYDSELWCITPDNGDIKNISFDNKNFNDSDNLNAVNKCWNTLEKQEIIESPRFTKIRVDSNYQLSDLKVFQHIQSQNLEPNGIVGQLHVENEWTAYGNDLIVNAADITLLDAQIMESDTSNKNITIKAIKSRFKPNTYIYGIYQEQKKSTLVVECEFSNHPETGLLQYRLTSWCKNDIDDTHNLANSEISNINGFYRTNEKAFSLKDVHYQIDTTQTKKEAVETLSVGVKQELFKYDNSTESSGDIDFTGVGGGNVIKSDVTQGNITFNGGGGANVILHDSAYGNTHFTGGGAANIIVKKGQKGDLIFDGGGLVNVLLHQSKEGRMNINAAGAANVLIRIGNGEYKAHLTALGNVSIHKGLGDSHVTMLGGLNTHTQIGSHQRDKASWRALGGLNVMTQVGAGTITSLLGGGGNVLTKMGDGDLSSIMLGGANIITHISNNEIKSNTYTIILGGLNILTKKGQGDILGIMGGGANVLTHIGIGNTHGVMLGGANILTKVGNGDLSGIMLGIGNVLTHVGNGQTLGIMGAVGNIFTKVGDGTSMGAMVGGGNIFTHVGSGEAWALMGGLGNVYTKIGNGNALALMIAKGNVFTHVGDGMSVALMLATGNIATKVGDGMTLAAMIGGANIFTHIGHDEAFAAMVGKGNVLTKVGNGSTLGLMLGAANIYTHIGDGTSIGLFAGKANIMTKVGNGTTLSAMFGKANIMTHVGDGITGVLALGQANIITKVGNGIAGVIAGAKGNIVTHVGDGITAALLGGKANVLTKVGDGITVGLLISKVGNIMTHIGNSATIGFAKGNANIITKVGYGLGINAAWGKANIFTHIGDGERYNFAKGNANIITKVGNGQELSVVKGNINIITHVGNGDNYTGAWGNTNVVTQIGDGRQVTLAKGNANIVTMVGKGDNYGIVWGKANISTKVGNGTQVTIAKGRANITTTVGDGLGVTVTYGDANINTKVGNDVSVNVAWGKYNVSTKVGDGLNVSVMKGTANANIHVGNGLGINASYAKNNVIVKIGNGDIYSLSVASSNTQSNKLATFFGNIKQSVLGMVGSQAINYLVQGDDATTSGSRKGKGAINLIEKSSIDGFKMNEIDKVESRIGKNLKSKVTEVKTPDLSDVNSDESNLTNNSPNLVMNGDFKHGFEYETESWNVVYTEDEIKTMSQYEQKTSTDTAMNTNGEDYWDHGIITEYEEPYEPNIAMYQDISGLMQDEVIELSFEYERQDNTPTENKLSVIWNGEVVFTSSSEDKSIAWQQQKIKLTANAENNRLVFTIPGSGGLQGNNYKLRNIVAKSAAANINKYLSDSDATKNALADKNNADENRQKLADEKQRQLDRISTTQTELESTDQVALEKNGQTERDAIIEEANSVTHNLTTIGQTLEVLSEHSQGEKTSDQQWSELFAEGILNDVQKNLSNTKKMVSAHVDNIKVKYSANLKKVKKSIEKSEYGVIQSEEHCQGAKLDTAKAKNDADKRYSDARDKKNKAEIAEKKASTMVEEARLRGDTEKKTATNISDKAQKEAKSVQLKESDKPNRHGAHGSGLSGEAAYVEGADNTPSSYIKPISTKKNDDRFNDKLTEINQELLDDAQQAINRLSINAGIRQKSANALPSSISNLNGHGVASYQQPSLRSDNLQYHKIGAIAVNLSGLAERPIFETLKQKFNINIDNHDKHFTFILTKNGMRIQKNIYLDNINDPTKQKIIEHFILANYSSFEAIPNELHLENDEIKSSHNNKDRILAEYVSHKWQMLTDSIVMSVDELHRVASVKGKIQGESYKALVTTLNDYHKKESNPNDLPIEKLQMLDQLRNQIDGYLLGHPDSERNDGLKQLQTQVNTRYKHAAALILDSHTINADNSFSHLYDRLLNANLKTNKHIYLDENGNFVTKGKNNLQNQDKLISGKNAIASIKRLVEKEYGSEITNQVFNQFTENEFARNGHGIDLSGLKKIHREIEQQVSPISSTLYIWKPTKHSRFGHAALQIGSGRLQLDRNNMQNNQKNNYVSWWPEGNKYIATPFNIATEENPDLRLRWYDLSQPVNRTTNFMTLQIDIQEEEKTNFNLGKDQGKNDKLLKEFRNKTNLTQGLEKMTPEIAGSLLSNPDRLQETVIPPKISQPFIKQWESPNSNPLEVSTDFSITVKNWIKIAFPAAMVNQTFALEIKKIKEIENQKTENLKTGVADGTNDGMVFRINLEGLDVAAMQKEWKRINSQPDPRYQLLTKNCSSIVARILKAGGADQLIGHHWKPRFGVWTPNELYQFSQKIQEARLAQIAVQQSKPIHSNLQALSDNHNKVYNKVAIDNDATPPNEKNNFSPLTRFFNDYFFGDYDRRREMTAIIMMKNAKKITLKGDAGRLTGAYYRGNNGIQEATDKKVVLFLHGSNTPAENQASGFYHYYNQQGIDMLAINMRGFGESDGSPTEQGMYADAQTMFRYLVNDKGVDPKNIIIHGYSMGAPIAAKLASEISANGQRIAGLLLDRPMPSMSKAIGAYKIHNPMGFTGQLAKKINGQLSVEKNLQGFSKDIPIILLTDCDELGMSGEKMRTKLLDKGYLVKGERTDVSHFASRMLMNQYGKQIISSLLSPEYVNNTNHRKALDSIQNPIKKKKVTNWGMVYVKPNDNGGDSRFDSQIIIQTEDDPIAAQAASSLAAKHAKNSIVVQLDADGNYRVVYGDPTQLSGKIRWQLVGHGRETSENNHLRLSNYNADELSNQLAKFSTVFSKENHINTTPEHISIVGCSLISDDKQAGFAHQFINALDQQGIRSRVSARVTEVAVDANGHKYTKDDNGEWVAKQNQNKVVLNWNKEGKITTEFEQIRNGIAEGDINLAKVGTSNDNQVHGAIADNNEVFTPPKKSKKPAKQSSSGSDNSSLSYSGNIQVSVGDGEFTTVNWGTSNLGIKVGTGGFKSLVFGDNNVMVHVGNGDSKHSVDIAGYQAFEGAQLFVGTRNVSFNLGRSNDLIVMLEKSIPTPPLINPFDGAASIAKVLESIACSGENDDWLSEQNSQWTLAGAKKFAIDMSGIDQTSDVDYKTLTDLNSQHNRSSRGLKSDLEATLNKKYNQWLGGSGNNNKMGKISRAEQLRQLNSKIAFNFAIGGQGADIQVTTGNWNLMFGDNIQSIMDTNLGSLFGLMTQQFTATGIVKTTFTYNLQNLPTKLKNKLLGRLASVNSDTTLGDIFGVDYSEDGKIISRHGEPIDVVAILKDMLAVVTEFGGEQLSAFTDPTKLLDSLQSSINMGKDGIVSFAESHGLKAKATKDQQNKTEVSINPKISITDASTTQAKNSETTEKEERPFGFNSLNIPNLFATIFNKDKRANMRDLAENLKENLAADVLNMEKKTLDFLRNSGHLKGDGDIHVSLGNYNFNWGGDGNDLGAYLGDNNNFWGGRGSDAFYATGISNIFTGGSGNDLGVLMGHSNMMFGGDGDDTAVIAGRINNVYLGGGLDKAFVFGEGGEIHTNAGNDYVVTTGNYNRIFSGSEQDFVVTIGNHNQISLEEGNDFSKIFGNDNSLNGGSGDDEIQLMGYHAIVNGGDGNDQLIAASFSKFSILNGNTGNDIIILGGYQNHFKGGEGIDSFLINHNVIDCYVDDISQEDNIVLGDIDWNKLWFERSGYDLKISHIRTPQSTGEQAAFERIGSTIFTQYFNGNQAKIVIEMTDKDPSDQREYVALSSNALAIQIQAMSTFPMKAGTYGFFDNINGEAKQMIAAAWTDTISGKGILV
ncbi:MARTX multifunctional-autoprocessing repeats-in-toxin holotoxin RtxA [Proteus alimentorum]|uniref:MARTX multifunctional-autoprocessing repeats-in-toxin holotoxin RtxA n=1 Tax=Proteus alimentorum TaxID=1973495 RepID=UPI000BFFFD87|nr:MARTX multifunctional-autoprocessing repeats-in-toxin holotoxin RtxA [Proteus alimentorum]